MQWFAHVLSTLIAFRMVRISLFVTCAALVLYSVEIGLNAAWG